jgi:hypothetical protein
MTANTASETSMTSPGHHGGREPRSGHAVAIVVSSVDPKLAAEAAAPHGTPGLLRPTLPPAARSQIF